MFKKFSTLLVEEANKKDIIDNETVEEYIYGLNNFLTTAVNIITALIVGLLFNMLVEIILFIFAYKCLRKYCGGSHADTAIKCYISSCVIYIIALIVIKYYPLSDIITISITVCSSIVLFFLSPVEAVKKPLDDMERKVFAFRSRISVLTALCLFFVLHYIPIEYTYHLSIVMTVSITAVALSAIVGKVQVKHAYKKKTIGL